MAFRIYGNNYLEVDLSDLNEKLRHLQSTLTKQQMEKLMYRTFREVAQKTRTIIAEEATRDYSVTQAWVKSQIKGYRLQMGAEIACVIPISGAKGVIGGRFRAFKLKKRVSTQVLKRGRSKLPEAMKNQGGQPPFVGEGKLNGVVFTRRTSKRFPIVRVVGLGVPQFPLNRPQIRIEQSILDFTAQRLEHNFDYMITKGNG